MAQLLGCCCQGLVQLHNHSIAPQTPPLPMPGRDPAGALPPEEGQPAAGPAANGLPAANRRPNQRGIAQSRVPDHVQHPERYTM